MIKKVLIANRGEIVSRICRACDELNIQSVAIYSDADKNMPYVQDADEAYYVGESPVQKSYLDVDAIFKIAKEAHVDAIHPGYGFLSENSSFAKQCRQNGFIFIGPHEDVMALMGDKIEARKTMQQANVPVVPGTSALDDVQEAIKRANEIGYPIMLKAASGGGGIGMQVVTNDDELADAYEQNKKRAQQFFANGNLYLEKYIESGKHIEIQVFADHFGNAVHLYERECSIQRRNQKVIEEALASTITKETKTKMYEAALRAVKTLNYTNAGTIEFLVDDHENFYFLEMNTRIQVEHPVTECITNTDLVKEQILVASQESLSFDQADLIAEGHAIEARIYAEDPDKFFPSPGLITHYVEPKGDRVRIEATIGPNVKVTPFYDPMISKVIVHENTRREAIQSLIKALNNYKIEGIKTNIPMIIKVLNHEQFLSGKMKTNFVQTHL